MNKSEFKNLITECVTEVVKDMDFSISWSHMARGELYKIGKMLNQQNYPITDERINTTGDKVNVRIIVGNQTVDIKMNIDDKHNVKGNINREKFNNANELKKLLKELREAYRVLHRFRYDKYDKMF